MSQENLTKNSELLRNISDEKYIEVLKNTINANTKEVFTKDELCRLMLDSLITNDVEMHNSEVDQIDNGELLFNIKHVYPKLREIVLSRLVLLKSTSRRYILEYNMVDNTLALKNSLSDLKPAVAHPDKKCITIALPTPISFPLMNLSFGRENAIPEELINLTGIVRRSTWSNTRSQVKCMAKNNPSVVAPYLKQEISFENLVKFIIPNTDNNNSGTQVLTFLTVEGLKIKRFDPEDSDILFYSKKLAERGKKIGDYIQCLNLPSFQNNNDLKVLHINFHSLDRILLSPVDSQSTTSTSSASKRVKRPKTTQFFPADPNPVSESTEKPVSQSAVNFSGVHSSFEKPVQKKMRLSFLLNSEKPSETTEEHNYSVSFGY